MTELVELREALVNLVHRRTEELRVAKRIARSKRVLVRELFEENRDAILVFRRDGALMNPAARRILRLEGRDTTEYAGGRWLSAWKFYRPDGSQYAAHELPAVRGMSGESVDAEAMILVGPDGARVEVETFVRPLPGGEAIAVFQDLADSLVFARGEPPTAPTSSPPSSDGAATAELDTKTSLEEVVEELERREEWLRSTIEKVERDSEADEAIVEMVFDRSPHPTIVFDAAGRAEPNAAAAPVLEALLFSDPASRFGLYQRREGERLAHRDLPHVRALRGEDIEEEWLFFRSVIDPDGIWVAVRARPLADGGALVVLRDVGARIARQSARQ